MILCIQECLHCQTHQGMPLNSTHILMSRGWPEWAGTGTPFCTLCLHLPRGMCAAPGWKRRLHPPAIIHLQPLLNTASPVLLHPGDASKSLCVWAQEPRQAQQIPTIQVGADPGAWHTAGRGSAAARSVRAQRKGNWPRTSILMKEVTSI